MSWEKIAPYGGAAMVAGGSAGYYYSYVAEKVFEKPQSFMAYKIWKLAVTAKGNSACIAFTGGVIALSPILFPRENAIAQKNLGENKS